MPTYTAQSALYTNFEPYTKKLLKNNNKQFQYT